MGIVDREFFGPRTAAELHVRMFLSRHLGPNLFPGLEQFPVGIEYGTDGRVEIIRLVPGVK